MLLTNAINVCLFISTKLLHKTKRMKNPLFAKNPVKISVLKRIYSSISEFTILISPIVVNRVVKTLNGLPATDDTSKFITPENIMVLINAAVERALYGTTNLLYPVKSSSTVISVTGTSLITANYNGKGLFTPLKGFSAVISAAKTSTEITICSDIS